MEIIILSAPFILVQWLTSEVWLLELCELVNEWNVGFSSVDFQDTLKVCW